MAHFCSRRSCEQKWAIEPIEKPKYDVDWDLNKKFSEKKTLKRPRKSSFCQSRVQWPTFAPVGLANKSGPLNPRKNQNMTAKWEFEKF
jgi:uncharacterized protein YjcR